MTLLLPGVPVDDPNVQQKFDAISLAWPNSGVGAFSAYRAAALAVVTGTAIIFDTIEWDQSGWFNAATGAFTPKIAGRYRLMWGIQSAAVLAADVYWINAVEKNGALERRGQTGYQRGGVVSVNGSGSALVTANGTTDTFKVALTHGVGAATGIQPGAAFTFFQGALSP